MINWGYWTFASELFDAVVIGREGYTYNIELPQLGGLTACLYSFNLVPAGHVEAPRELPPGSGVRVLLHLGYDAKQGFVLKASERDARVNELGAFQQQALGGGQTPYVVRVRVFEKMTGALGVRILSAPYQGFSGVVHRADLPGRLPADQHRFADQARIGEEFFARLLTVKAEHMAHWQTTLSLRNVPPAEHMPAVTEPPSMTPTVGGVRRFRPIGENSLEAVVAEREGQVVRLIFKPKPHTQMVLNLRWRGLSGANAAERYARFAKLAVGDRLVVTPEFFQSPDTGLELRALEVPAKVAALAACAAKVAQHRILSAVVTRNYVRQAQVTVLSPEGRGLTGWIDLDGGPAPKVGETVRGRLVGLGRSAGGWASVRLSARLFPEALAAGESWTLTAA
jgi:hypothetical protein